MRPDLYFLPGAYQPVGRAEQINPCNFEPVASLRRVMDYRRSLIERRGRPPAAQPPMLALRSVYVRHTSDRAELVRPQI